MFQSQVYFPVTMTVDYDPTADKTFPVWRAPAACEIKSAYATVIADVAASTADYFTTQLLNGGAAARRARPRRRSRTPSAVHPAGPDSRPRRSR